LAGKADAGNIVRFCVCLLQRFFYGCTTGAPPIERVLFGPAVFRGRKGLVLVRARRSDFAAFVKEKRACAAGANVNS